MSKTKKNSKPLGEKVKKDARFGSETTKGMKIVPAKKESKGR